MAWMFLCSAVGKGAEEEDVEDRGTPVNVEMGSTLVGLVDVAGDEVSGPEDAHYEVEQRQKAEGKGTHRPSLVRFNEGHVVGSS